MPNIVLNTKPYVPTGVINGASMFWEQSGGLVNAFSPLSARVNYTGQKTNVAWKLTIPVVKPEDSACGCAGDVARTAIVDITVRLDRDATSAERADIEKRISDLVANAQFKASITNLTLPA